MSAERSTPILPKGKKEERPLFVIMAIMSFLASLTLIIVLMGLRQSASWQNDLQSAATVQIMSSTDSGQMDAALSVLRNQNGVTSATALSSRENRDLLSPWIGTAALPDDLIIPSLVRLEVDRSEFDGNNLSAALEAAKIEAVVDDHQQWSDNLSSTWARIRLALLSLLSLILIATAAISSFATQSVLQARQNIIKVLGQVGANDGFIARLFVLRFLSVGFKAAITGMVLALGFMAFFMVFQNWGTDENGLKINIEIMDIIWLISLAIIMGTISAVTAGLSARRAIEKPARNG